ncbi:MAG: T9SS type A sorting domain-containing protein [Bacteroidetes bacterium]|nr:T9SS type A sorting domain-containing protein [Bacteroidota bacterium]
MKNLFLILFLFVFWVDSTSAQEGFSNYFERNIKHRKCVTPLLTQARKRVDELTPNAKILYKTFSTRPTLSNEKIFKTNFFDIHYTLSGKDSTPKKDADASGIPDYIEKMAKVFDYVYMHDSVEGYTMPPFDAGEGGSNKYDVYVSAIGFGYYGFLQPDNLIGDNPKSKLKETSAYTSWMGMNNNYSFDPAGTDTAIMVTIAHEFFHAIQFGYTSENTSFFAEATAVWMEDHIYPDIENNLQYLPTLFNAPDLAMDISDTAKYSDMPYSRWIYFKYITEQTSPKIIKQFLEATIGLYDIEAIDSILKNKYKLNFKNILNDFFIANSVMDTDTNFKAYRYANADKYLNYLTAAGSGLKVEKSFNLDNNKSISHSSNLDGNGRLMHLSADYFKVKSAQNFHVRMTPRLKKDDLAMYLIKRNKSQHELYVSMGDTKDSVFDVTVDDAANYDDFTILVSRTDKTNQDTFSAQYALVLDHNIVGLPETEEAELPYISVYPNPAKEYFNFEWNTDGMLKDLSIYDMNGKLAYRQKDLDAAGEVKIDINGWAKGAYVVFSKDAAGNIYSTKLIVQGN